MANLRLLHLLVLLICGALISTAPLTGLAANAEPNENPTSAPKAPALTNDDCAKCHAKAPADIAAVGGKHKTNVACLDCHQGHPPTVQNNIPKCDNCHSGKPHYQISNCGACHRNPHAPKKITFDKNMTEACLSCHTEQDKALKGTKSKHSVLTCGFCHNEHGKIPPCTQCHQPHASDQAPADCKSCHQAHAPNMVTYKNDTPSRQCAGCHRTPFQQLSSSTTRHHSIACATCHQTKHKSVPKCEDCHGAPHPAAMMSRFSSCGECHHTAHDLNHWQPKATGGGEGQGKKKKGNK